MSDPPPLSPQSEAPPKKRPLSQWLTLLAVWSAGLVVWAIYIVALLYLFFRVFT